MIICVHLVSFFSTNGPFQASLRGKVTTADSKTPSNDSGHPGNTRGQQCAGARPGHTPVREEVVFPFTGGQWDPGY